MDVFDTIRSMMQASGLSFRKLGELINRKGGYISSILFKRRVPSASILAMIADACGYDLLVRRRDDSSEIIIDPPNNDD